MAPLSGKRLDAPFREVEYEVDDPGRPQAEDRAYRLATTILEPEGAPATDLAGLYAERWEFETALDELKTHQRGPRLVLRSKTADRAYQEAWGVLCVHYAIRALTCRAAGCEQTRGSFAARWATSP